MTNKKFLSVGLLCCINKWILPNSVISCHWDVCSLFTVTKLPFMPRGCTELSVSLEIIKKQMTLQNALQTWLLLYFTQRNFPVSMTTTNKFAHMDEILDPELNHKSVKKFVFIPSCSGILPSVLLSFLFIRISYKSKESFS